MNRPFLISSTATPRALPRIGLRVSVQFFSLALGVLGVLGLILGDVGVGVLLVSLALMLATLAHISAQLEQLHKRSMLIEARLETLHRDAVS